MSESMGPLNYDVGFSIGRLLNLLNIPEDLVDDATHQVLEDWWFYKRNGGVCSPNAKFLQGRQDDRRAKLAKSAKSPKSQRQTVPTPVHNKDLDNILINRARTSSATIIDLQTEQDPNKETRLISDQEPADLLPGILKLQVNSSSDLTVLAISWHMESITQRLGFCRHRRLQSLRESISSKIHFPGAVVYSICCTRDGFQA